MKHIVLSEGPNDIYFLRELIKDSYNIEEYDTFHNEDAEISQVRRIDHSLLEDSLKLLLKSEGGYDKVIGMISETIFKFYNNPIEMTVVLDLDQDRFNSCITDINTVLTRDWGNKVNIYYEHRSQHTDIYSADCILEIDGHGSKSFNLITFFNDLESATNITNSDGPSEKISKVQSYIQKDHSGIAEFRNTLDV